MSGGSGGEIVKWEAAACRFCPDSGQGGQTVPLDGTFASTR